MSVDPLVFLPVDRWSELKSVFKADWPRSILGFLMLEDQELLLKSGIDYGFKVYCPFGDINNGMVALNIKNYVVNTPLTRTNCFVSSVIMSMASIWKAHRFPPFRDVFNDYSNTYYDVIIQCPKDDTSELEKAMKTTTIVDWKKCDQIPVMPKHVMDCVNRLYSENLNMNPTENSTKADAFVLDKEAPPYDIRLPPGFSFKFLSLDSVQSVNDTWPHKYPGSEWYFELLINAKLGYGLYNGTELIAWVFLREIGALGHLYTLEKHRRKGYGELVLKLISNILLKEKKYTVAYCAAYNTNAANLYKKLGFKNLLKIDWCNF